MSSSTLKKAHISLLFFNTPTIVKVVLTQACERTEECKHDLHSIVAKDDRGVDSADLVHLQPVEHEVDDADELDDDKDRDGNVQLGDVLFASGTRT